MNIEQRIAKQVKDLLWVEFAEWRGNVHPGVKAYWTINHDNYHCAVITHHNLRVFAIVQPKSGLPMTGAFNVGEEYDARKWCEKIVSGLL